MNGPAMITTAPMVSLRLHLCSTGGRPLALPRPPAEVQ